MRVKEGGRERERATIIVMKSILLDTCKHCLSW